MHDTLVAKRRAAEAAAALVADGMRLGLGTGSTAEIMLRLLAERVRGGLRVAGVPTSERTALLARELDIPLISLADEPHLDLALDGADEFDGDLNLIKGGGGALLREKIVAAAARRFVVMADESKRADRLGRFPLPVEIVGMAERPLQARLQALGARQTRLRLAADRTPFVTDEGHRILDCAFERIENPTALAGQISQLAGVVEHGLFVGMADEVLVGRSDGVERLARR